MKKKKKLTTEGGRASLLMKRLLAVEASSNGTTCLRSSLLVTNKELEDRPKQTKKKRVKLKWLIKNIPKEGPRAKEIFMDRRK